MPIEKPLAECQQEAYTHVLRAFQAQKSNDWSRQKLLINLRRELKISNERHLKTLGEVVNDMELKELSGGAGSRDKIARQSSGTIPDVSTRGPAQTSQQRVRENSMDASQDKWQSKKSCEEARSSKNPSQGKSPSQSHSHGTRSPNLHTAEGCPAAMAPPSSRKPENAPSMSGGQAPNSTTSTLTPSVPLPDPHRIGQDNINEFIGRQVESFWADQDPQWIEALVTDYKAETRMHCLAYDFNGGNESWEWVDLNKMMREGQVRLLPGQPIAPGLLANATRLTRLDPHAQAAPAEKASGKRRSHLMQNGQAIGGTNSMQAPFECNVFEQKLQHAGLEELEAMHRSVLKRQKMVLDKLLDLGDGKLKSEDPLVKALVERERLCRRADDLGHELSVLNQDR